MRHPDSVVRVHHPSHFLVCLRRQEHFREPQNFLRLSVGINCAEFTESMVLGLLPEETDLIRLFQQLLLDLLLLTHLSNLLLSGLGFFPISKVDPRLLLHELKGFLIKRGDLRDISQVEQFQTRFGVHLNL